MNSPASSPTQLASAPASPPRLVELVALAAMCLLAALLRAGNPAGLSVEHFDEGVYASNLWFDAKQGYAYPMRHLYAPPLAPFIAEWSLILTGMTPGAPVWAGVLAGLALIPSLWWIGRAWFGARAGLTIAALAAVSDMHVLFSRTVLTEPWLLLGLVWAVFVLERAVRRGRKADIILGGLLTGVCWWIKYNGWLPLAIAGAGTVVHYLVMRRRISSWRSDLMRSLAAWSVAALIAFLTWLPVPLGLGDQGGYSAVAANHRRYVVGFAGWWESAEHQWANLRSLEGGSTRVLGPAALVVLFLILNRQLRASTQVARGTTATSSERPTQEPPRRANSLARFGLTLAPLLLAGIAAEVSLLAGLFAATAIAALVRRRCSLPPTSQPTSQGLAFVICWFAGLLVATPCYHPYARLTLPWLVATWIGGGWALSQLLQLAGWRANDQATPMETGAEVQSAGATFVLGAVLLGMAGGAALILFGPRIATRAWYERPFLLGQQDRGGLARATAELAAAASREATDERRLDPDAPIIFYVYGEPAVFFHLRAAGHVNVAPVADPSVARPPTNNPTLPTFLITGPHASDEANWEQVREGLIAANEWTPIMRAEFQPSDVLRLDHEDPRATQPPRRYELSLFRVRSLADSQKSRSPRSRDVEP